MFLGSVGFSALSYIRSLSFKFFSFMLQGLRILRNLCHYNFKVFKVVVFDLLTIMFKLFLSFLFLGLPNLLRIKKKRPYSVMVMCICVIFSFLGWVHNTALPPFPGTVPQLFTALPQVFLGRTASA